MDYRGEIGVILYNTSESDIIINHGDKIAQLVFMRIEKVKWNRVGSKLSLDITKRGEGGYGHTGK